MSSPLARLDTIESAIAAIKDGRAVVVICVAVTESDADRLDLPPMFRVNQDRRGTAYTVTVDAREGITTGISAS